MLSYVDAPYEHLCKCEHLTKSSSCGGMCRSPHASPPPRAREFSGGVISHHLTDFGAVPVLAILCTRGNFFARAFAPCPSQFRAQNSSEIEQHEPKSTQFDPVARPIVRCAAKTDAKGSFSNFARPLKKGDTIPVKRSAA